MWPPSAGSPPCYSPGSWGTLRAQEELDSRCPPLPEAVQEIGLGVVDTGVEQEGTGAAAAQGFGLVEADMDPVEGIEAAAGVEQEGIGAGVALETGLVEEDIGLVEEDIGLVEEDIEAEGVGTGLEEGDTEVEESMVIALQAA